GIVEVNSDLALSNCTVAGNVAAGGSSSGGPGGTADAGGLTVGDAGFATLIGCTIASNQAIGGSGATSGQGVGGGIMLTSGGAALTNTIVATNTAVTHADIDGSISGATIFNLIGDGTGSNISNGDLGNQVGTTAAPINPRLAPLANYGGPTPTMALLALSPAIDAGDTLVVTTGTDQRGYARVFNGTVDIGAFEFQPIHLLAVGAD